MIFRIPLKLILFRGPRAITLTAAFYIMYPIYYIADRFARWFEEWDLRTFGW